MTQQSPGRRTALAAIHDKMPALPPAQARVAAIFLERPEEAIRLSVASLAYEAKVGEASVIRFCRAIGFDNLHELRAALADETVYRRRDAPRTAGDLIERLRVGLRETANGLDHAALRRVAAAMVDAPHIDIFGSGVSGMGAQLFAYRLARVGLLARGFNDEVVADEITPSRRRGSVALVVSETGLTLRTERFLKHSRQAGALTVAVCGQGSEALAPLCDEIIAVTPLNPLPKRGELSPLIGKLVICDLLAAEIVALQSATGPKSRKRG